jgi:hypothetical protein
LGDAIEKEMPDPDQIDPLVFVPKTVAEFKSLGIRIGRMVGAVDPALRLALVQELTTVLTKPFHRAQLSRLAEKVRAIERSLP